jgi:RNA polymerase sigma-70 factor (sigma-E family)
MPTSAFEQYVSARSGALLRFAYLLCRDGHLAEDLVQEVLIKAHRRWAMIEAENPDAYLRQALVRAHISWRRRRSSSEIATDTFLESARGSTGFDDAHATRDELWGLLAMLPRAQRAVLVLRYFEDLDDHRIAELVGSKASTVRVHAHRGLNTLRELLAERADHAPAAGADLVDTVRRGAARAARRRRTTTSAVIGIVVVLLALLVPVWKHLADVPPIAPTPSVSPTTPGPSLVPFTIKAPDFPYPFSWLPPGRGAGARVEVVGGQPRLLYGGERGTGLSVTLSTQPYQWDWEANPATSTTVNGAPASLRATEPSPDHPVYIGLTWPQDGRWITVECFNGAVSVSDLRRFAESIAPGTTGSSLTGGLAAVARIMVPPGYVMSTQEPDEVWFDPPGVAQDVHDAGTLKIMVTSNEVPYGGFKVVAIMTIDGFPARLYEDGTDGHIGLAVFRSDGRIVEISYHGQPPGPTRDDLLAMYRGVVLSR